MTVRRSLRATTKAGKEIELSAEVQPTPTIASIAPDFGPVAGGTTVTITGTDLASASAVKFGTVPAASFKAESETEITAVAPPSATVGAVDVTATTIAGTSATVKDDRFFYEGCAVPGLKGKKLKVAKRALQPRRLQGRQGQQGHAAQGQAGQGAQAEHQAGQGAGVGDQGEPDGRQEARGRHVGPLLGTGRLPQRGARPVLVFGDCPSHPLCVP